MRFCVNVMSISCRNFIENAEQCAEWQCRRRQHCLHSDSWSMRKVQKKKNQTENIRRLYEGMCCVCAFNGTRCTRKCEKWEKNRSSDVPSDLAIIKDNDIVNVLVECAVRWKSNVHGRHLPERGTSDDAPPNEGHERTYIFRMKKHGKLTKMRMHSADPTSEINGIVVARHRHIHGKRQWQRGTERNRHDGTEEVEKKNLLIFYYNVLVAI